jgi:hypothetical protein
VRVLVCIGAVAMLGCVTPHPTPDGWQAMPEGSSLRRACERDGFAVVDHEGELRIAATLGEIVGTKELVGGSPRPWGEGWLVVVPGSRGPGWVYESKARGQALERTEQTNAVAAVVERDRLLLADNHCQIRGLHVESSIVQVEPARDGEDGPTRTTFAGPWPICIRAMARDADARIWLLANLHPHYDVELYNVLFRLDSSGSVLHHEYTLNAQPDLEVVGTGGLTHMEIVDGMIWLSGVETPVVRLRRDGGRWIEEMVVPSDCPVR